ncbi:hypothetical protein GJAV_G00115960, partial [Gymnothorax javanicus]
MVTTVEETALFRAAYPDLVDRFLKEREEAKENKLKKKKQMKMKGKDSNVGLDDFSNLFSQMTIDSFSTDKVGTSGFHTAATADPKIAQESLSCPQSSDQKTTENHRDLTASWGFCVTEVGPRPSPLSSGKMAATAASPSVSALIDELHLSEIDWEGVSFTSSLSPQIRTGHPLPSATDDLHTSLKGLNGIVEKKCITSEMEGLAGFPLSVLHASRGVESQASANMSKISMREKVIANFMPCDTHADSVTAQTNQSTNSSECSAFNDVFSSTSSNDSCFVSHLGQQESHCNKSLTSDSENVATVKHSMLPMINTVKTQGERSSVSTKPQSRHELVKISCDERTFPPRGHSDQSAELGHKSRIPTVKRSVCVSVCSSSENSDSDSRQIKEQRKVVKSKARKRCAYSKLDQTKMGFPATVGASSNTADRLPEALSSDQGKSGCTPAMETNWEAADEDFMANSVLHAHVNITKGDDSVISVDSPLPLVERLKL